ncbi:MAG: hypothetical protein H6Q15_2494 [Bacteroidetes bacterium]|nr:hypothetical protein [Bacteroidota bacterium]
MKSLKINSELFILNHGENYILYLPLKSVIVIVNEDTIKLLNAISEGKNIDSEMEIVDKLIDLGVFEEPILPFDNEIFKPTDVTFLPSFSCNLECLYCYSEGGEFITSKIPLKTAKKAIDIIIKNAIELNRTEITVGFHGGGEPMMVSNMPFIEGVIKYTEEKSKENNLKYTINAVTNGVDIDKFDPKWIKEKITRFNVSLDGPIDIQNHQRPRRGKNKDSYTPAIETIKFFEKNNIDYGIRTTITQYSVNRMSEIVEHFTKISSLKSFHFEPLFECGRCKTSKFTAPPYDEFIDNFKKANEIAKKLNVTLNYSGASDGRISDKFCGGAGENFFVTPDSFVSTCLEACRTNEKESKPFLIGSFNKELNEFEFDQEKINILKSRKVTNMKSCADCFCKYSCAGDCLIKVFKNTGDLFDSTNSERCNINTAITELKIKERIC